MTRMEKLRIILTEECDLACRYCRRSGNAAQAERSAVLAAAEGAERVELAGGEPLLWPDVCGLVRELKAQPGTVWVGLTTNGTRARTAGAGARQGGARRRESAPRHLQRL